MSLFLKDLSLYLSCFEITNNTTEHSIYKIIFKSKTILLQVLKLTQNLLRLCDSTTLFVQYYRYEDYDHSSTNCSKAYRYLKCTANQIF